MLDIHKNPLLVSILNGCELLKAMDIKKEIPLDHICHARALLFMKTDKIGFGVSITQGHGLVIARAPHRPSGWSAPLPVRLDGFSIGAVVGISSQDSLICLANDDDINSFKAKKKALKMGVDIGVSVDVNVKGMTMKYDKALAYDTQNITQTGDKFNTKAFTISKGTMIDLALNGISVEVDYEDIEASYGATVTATDILEGNVSPPREATILYNLILNYTDRYSAPATTSS